MNNLEYYAHVRNSLSVIESNYYPELAWVPHDLRNSSRSPLVSLAQCLLPRFCIKNFLGNIVKGDEPWVSIIPGRPNGFPREGHLHSNQSPTSTRRRWWSCDVGGTPANALLRDSWKRHYSDCELYALHFNGWVRQWEQSDQTETEDLNCYHDNAWSHVAKFSAISGKSLGGRKSPTHRFRYILCQLTPSLQGSQATEDWGIDTSMIRCNWYPIRRSSSSLSRLHSEKREMWSAIRRKKVAQVRKFESTKQPPLPKSMVVAL